jgi:uncharacterized protein (TIGR02246 family)
LLVDLHSDWTRRTEDQAVETISRTVDRGKTGEVIMSKTDEDAIREIELRFNAAWGRHDPDGMVESLLDDAQFVTVNGAWTRTRDSFRELMRRLHGPDGPFRASTRETPEMHVRFLAPDVAVMHTRFHIYGDVDEKERNSVGLRVVRKVDGRWRTVAVQNTDVRAGRRH